MGGSGGGPKTGGDHEVDVGTNCVFVRFVLWVKSKLGTF